MSFCGTGLGNFPQPGDPSNDAVLSAQAGRGGIVLSWTFPSMNPEAVAFTTIFRNSVNNFATAAVLRGNAAGDYFFDRMDVPVGTQFYYWIQFTSVNKTVGDVIGPASATIQPTVAKMIELLEGQVLESILHADLKAKITKIATIETDLLAEADARLIAENIFSTTLAQLQGNLDAVDTLVQSEIVARVAGDTALVTSIDAIAVQSNANQAAIIAEQTVRADADSALATSIDTVVASAAANASAITAEATARADADSALSQAITTVSSNVDTNAAAIQAEITARTDADTALSQQITTVLAATESNLAAIQLEATARTDADTALSQSIVTLNATVEGNYAAFQTEQTTRADADTALSQSITTLQSTVGNNTALIQATQTVTDGVAAEWMLKTDVNGYVSGFGLYNTGATSQFIIRSDLFAVGAAGESDEYPFIIGQVNGETKIALNATALIPDAQITNAMIGGYIQSYDYDPITHAGWKISKSGLIEANGLIIYDSNGNVLLSSGGAMGSALTALGETADWDSITGDGKAASNATVGADSSNLASGISANLLANASLRINGSQWGLTYTTGTASKTVTHTPPGSEAPPGVGCISVNESSVLGTGVADLGYAPSLEVTTGERYEFSVYARLSNTSQAWLLLHWYDATDTLISTSTVATTTTAQTGSPYVLTDWVRLGGISQAPANAVYAKVVFRKGGRVASGGSTTRICRPYFGAAHAGQTELSVWSTGSGSSDDAVQPGNPITSSNVDDVLYDNVLNGATKIINLSVDTLKLADQAVTIPVGVQENTTVDVPYQAWVLAIDATIVSTGAPTFVMTSLEVESNDGDWRDIYIEVRRGSTVLWASRNISIHGGVLPVTIAIVDQPPAGTNTYGVYAKGGSTQWFDIESRSLLLLETKK